MAAGRLSPRPSLLTLLSEPTTRTTLLASGTLIRFGAPRRSGRKVSGNDRATGGPQRTLRSLCMQNRSSRSGDLNALAASIVDDATNETPRPESPEPEKDPAAVALGRRGGLKGGRARAERLTPEQRSEAGRKAARARWGTARDDTHG